MINLTEELVMAASDVAVRERHATVSLLQRRLRIGYTSARQILNELELRRVLDAPNADGLHHAALHLLTPTEGKQPAQQVHVRLIRDLALYLLENHGYESTVAVKILADPFKASRNELRELVREAMGLERSKSLFSVALAIAHLPQFASSVPAESIHQDLQAECARTEVRTERPDSAMRGRLAGLFYATRYLKRRIMEGLAPHSRAVEAFVHQSLLPHGQAHSATATYREHVVPCVLVQAKATELLRHGIPEAIVAEWIEPFVRIVRIDKADAKQLDGPLGLKQVMPDGWQFGHGCVYARLHQLEIDFAPPADGPACTCATHAQAQAPSAAM